nr:hypothetical protein [Nanoarchaeum sp.]
MKMAEEIKYDGLTIKGYNGSTIISFNISEAFDKTNLRSDFLKGQLYVELLCDNLISTYLKIPSGIELGVFHDFLASRHCPFEAKIAIINLMKDPKTNEPLVERKLIASLKLIGEIRNAFQHNIQYKKAINSLADSRKFQFANNEHKITKYLESGEIEGTKKLRDDYETEATNVYLILYGLIESMGGRKDIVK